MTDDLLTARETMAILKCSRAFLTDHAADMGAEKLGNLWRVSRANLEAWRARGRMQPAEPVTEPAPTPIRAKTRPPVRGSLDPVTLRRVATGGRS